MIQINTLSVKIVLLIVCIFIGVAHATSLPSHYPPRFNEVGTVDRIDYNQLKIVIGDKIYSLSANVEFKRLNPNRTGSLSDLSVGDYVGCRLAGKTLIGIYELPKNYTVNENDK